MRQLEISQGTGRKGKIVSLGFLVENNNLDQNIILTF